ncbi:aspartate ammonia-lyase [Edaphobacter sp. 12200R-103]|uniref:aspartate ammonia-lyase n=1 Tax=Edaphobacter sp. 12200R-103 TaxID=2703788 RepID=UPI00138B905B|nr:aspartate ammonia-lyase [Edaphobacter sp. 12200R-103]QHS52159.1 aspartate ammonia-lyase [Edaphobacter sp. 12200R-103]
MSKLRKETDSLGAVEVPAEALYGAQTSRAVANFPISGLKASPFLIRALAMIKLAAAEANTELGLITDEQGRVISQAAQEVLDGKHHEHFVVDVFQAGAGVSLHMNTNEVLANRANQILGDPLGSYKKVHPNDHVNYGQSTNDVFPTVMRLSALLALEELYPVLDSLAAAFSAKAEEFKDILKAGRTHMQDAVPITLGQEFAAYAAAVKESSAAIRRNAVTLHALGLGGSAVGTGLNTHPEYRHKAVAKLARLSRLELHPAYDLRYAMQSCAPMADVSGALRGLALEMIRISNDLRLLSSGPNTGFNEIHLPSLQPGSSIMPGKVNPVLPELTAMVAFQVIGNDTATAMAVQAGQLELNVMMPAMAHATLQSITILTNTLRELDHRCVRGITANRERNAFYASSTIALATALNPYIGYRKAAELVKESVASGRSIVDLAREKKLLSEEQIAEILDPKNMTEPRARVS